MNDYESNEVIETYLADISASDKTEKTNERIVLFKYKEYSQIIQKDMFSYTYEDFLNMFSFNQWFTKNVIANRKCIILRFLDYAETNGYCTSQYKNDFKNRMKDKDISRDTLFETQLFSSFDDFYKLIDKINKTIPLEEIDKSVFTIGALILCWYGLSIEELITVKVEDYEYCSGIVRIPAYNKEIVIKDSRARAFLEDCKYKEEVRYTRFYKGGKKKDIVRHLLNNEFLIKSITKPELTVQYTRCLISAYARFTKGFDITDKDYSKQITYKGIYTSGLYERIRSCENIIKQEISYKNLDVFDEMLSGELLEGRDKKNVALTTKARRIVTEYLDYKKYLSRV